MKSNRGFFHILLQKGRGIAMLITKPYQRERAVEYARRWALGRNPLFADFTGRGGNCTNFVSQCVLAGSCVMNRTEDFGWYYISEADRAPAWSSVEYFYDFMTGVPAFASRNGGIGPYAREVPRREAMIGDVVQYANQEMDWYHTVIISRIENGEIYICAHSDDALDRPISSYNFAMARFLHIEGVRFEKDDTSCFDYLISGGEAPPLPPFENADLPEPPSEPTEPTPPTDTAEAPTPPPSENDRPDVVEGS